MAKTRFDNVVVFGDSLSDIGTKWTQPMGRVARKIKEMTVSPVGRFSDCRNWADHMYETATGDTLIKGTPQSTIARSRRHTSFSGMSQIDMGRMSFKYANYAEGGATGGIPANFGLRLFALNQFKDQVEAFRRDYANTTVKSAERFLFIVWFGANDLYTAGAKATAMGEVAEKIAKKRRNEVATIVQPKNAKFIFCNLGPPLSATRYQLVHDKRERKRDSALQRIQSGAGAKKDLTEMKKFMEARNMINNFESGVQLFNKTLRETAERNGDIYVDIAAAVSPSVVSGILGQMELVKGSQDVGTSNVFISSGSYEAVHLFEDVKITTSDDVHPTDRMYKYMWEIIKAKISENQYTFGNLPD